MSILPTIGAIASDGWIFAGLTTSFSNVRPDPISRKDAVELQLSAQGAEEAQCRIIEVTSADGNSMHAVELAPENAVPGADSSKAQVLIFQYRGRFHAVDNQCPHQSYALCRGEIRDIEDFGIILSTAITCPKHGWAFDLTTGESSRGRYHLPVWDVNVRDAARPAQSATYVSDSVAEDTRQVWIRRRP